jgi:transcriptional regulator
MSRAPDVLQGTLDLLILKVLSIGPLHGWAIARRIQDLSRDTLAVNQGSLYPALYRLEERGWITGEDGELNGRRIKVYRTTSVGRKQLAREIDEWSAFALGVGRVIRAGA